MKTMTKVMLAASILSIAACTKNPDQAGTTSPDVTPAPAPAATSEPAAAPAAAANVPTDNPAPADLAPNIDLPAGVTADAVKPGECMTPLDTLNGVAPAATYAPGSQVKAVGWNITSSKTDPTPTLVYGVFKPLDPAARGSLLTGQRMARPDVAANNAVYQMAGYELGGAFPATAGKYRLYVWTGTPTALTECDTRMEFTLQ